MIVTNQIQYKHLNIVNLHITDVNLIFVIVFVHRTLKTIYIYIHIYIYIYMYIYTYTYEDISALMLMLLVLSHCVVLFRCLQHMSKMYKILICLHKSDFIKLTSFSTKNLINGDLRVNSACHFLVIWY